MNIETTTTFLGWCVVLNTGLLILAVVLWMTAKEALSKLGVKLSGVTAEEFRVTVLRVLMQYRLGIVPFTFVPYLALKIMG